MESGMLWYDDDNRRRLDEKVARAVQYYKDKYGAAPTVCFVNPRMLPDGLQIDMAGGVYIRTARNVLVNHFLIGVEAIGAAESKQRVKTNGGNGRRPDNGNGKDAGQR